MTEATTDAIKRDAMNRAHAERGAAFASIFASLFGRKSTTAPSVAPQAA